MPFETPYPIEESGYATGQHHADVGRQSEVGGQQKFVACDLSQAEEILYCNSQQGNTEGAWYSVLHETQPQN